MPDRRPPSWSALRTGLGWMALLALGAAAVFFLDVVLRELSEGPELVVTASAARNLEPGAAVWVGGVPAGRVKAVRFREGAAEGRPVVVRTVLRQDAADHLRRDASASIHESALLAPAVVSIRPGSASAAYDFRDTLPARRLVGPGELMARLDSLGRELRALRPLARRLARRLEEGPGTLAALGADTALARELAGLADRAAALSDRAGSGTAGRLAADEELAATWRQVAARSRRIAARIGSRAAPVAATLDSLATTASRLARRVEAGRGSLGRLMVDPALAREARAIRTRLDSARAELLADPLAWLRFRLF